MTLNEWKNLDEAVCATEDCIADISTWMEYNLLKLNQNKTELMVFFTSSVLRKLELLSQGRFQLPGISKISKNS